MKGSVKMQKEIKVPGVVFNQKYLIDENGVIWSPYRGGKILSPSPTKKGYYRIVLQTNIGKKTFQVHRLVLMTFKPCDNMDTLEVNHIDGDKSNNHLDNLEWCSGSMNVRHSLETGLKIPARGEQISCHKLTEEEVIEICERLKRGRESLQEIANSYGVSKHTVFDIKRKRSWRWLTEDYKF